MKPAAIAVVALVVLLVAVGFQISHYSPLLPDTVASHFNLSGEADGWSPKSEFLLFYVIILSGTITFFVGLPVLMFRLPASLIGLPNKDYWLAPERREEAFKKMTTAMLWMGNATVMFLSHTFGVTMAANLTSAPRLGAAFIWGFGLYLVFTAIWLLVLRGRFARTEG